MFECQGHQRKEIASGFADTTINLVAKSESTSSPMHITINQKSRQQPYGGLFKGILKAPTFFKVVIDKTFKTFPIDRIRPATVEQPSTHNTHIKGKPKKQVTFKFLNVSPGGEVV
uniref:Uncharacterized protein n=1 Tax=Glossina austeni TaxID=7395 RepID=A0A1A9VHX5_GLOAU